MHPDLKLIAQRIECPGNYCAESRRYGALLSPPRPSHPLFTRQKASPQSLVAATDDASARHLGLLRKAYLEDVTSHAGREIRAVVVGGGEHVA